MNKIKKYLLVLILLLIPLISFKAKNGVITEMDADYSNSCHENDGTCDLNVTGTVDGALAVAIIVYNDTESEIVSMVTTGVDSENNFSETITLPHKNYVVKAADYDGGEYRVVLVSNGEIGMTEEETEAQMNTIESDLLKMANGSEEALVNKYEMNAVPTSTNIDDYSVYTEEENLSTIINKTAEAAASINELNTIATEAGTNNIKYAALYDINILIEEDGVGVIGRITELKTPITMSIDLPDSLPSVKSGFKRVYKVIAIHTEDDTTTRKIISDVEVKGSQIVFKSSEISKFFVVYFDKAIEQGSEEIEENVEKDLVLTPSYTYIKLSWDENASYTGYKIYRKVSGGSYSVIKTITSKSTTTYKDATALPGKTYYYKVRPYKVKSGKTVYGDYTSYVSSKLKKPATTEVSISSSYTYLKLTWEKKTSGKGYKIYRSTDEDSGYKLIKTITSNTTTTYKDTTVLPGKTYYYKVKTYRTVNGKTSSSSYSNIESAKLKKPAATELTADSHSSYVKITWEKKTSGKGYKIYRSTDEDSGYKLIKTITGNTTTTYKDKSIKSGVTYYYKVKTYRIVNGKTNSSSYSNIESGYITHFFYLK